MPKIDVYVHTYKESCRQVRTAIMVACNLMLLDGHGVQFDEANKENKVNHFRIV